MVVLCAAACAAVSLPRAGAEPKHVQVVTDRLGRFTITFPIGWKVQTATMQQRRPSPAFVSNDAVSMVMGTAPHASGEAWPTDLPVIAGILKRPMSPAEMSKEVRLGPGPDGEPPPATKLLEEGNTAIGGRPAYYRYEAMHDDDTDIDVVLLFGFLPADNVGISLFGHIKKTRLRKDTAVILHIVESLRPAPPRRGDQQPRGLRQLTFGQNIGGGKHL